MASSLGISPLLKPNVLNNSKWHARDPLDVLDEATLHALHQELIRDKEIYTRPESFLNRDGNACHQSVNGQYYCGQQVLDCQCCNGICGPSHGCSCKSCQQVLEECRENSGDLKSYVSAANDHIEAWSWGHTPTISELKSFSKLVAHKQLTLFKSSLESNPYLHNLKMELYVYSRYLSVHSRLSFVKTEKENKTVTATIGEKEDFLKSSTEAVAVSEDMLKTSSMKMMLKYIFKYFVQSLQEGGNQNLSSELLNEALDLFGGIPEVLLFKERDESKGLIESLDQAFQFMLSFIKSPENCQLLSIKDRKMFISLLFEFVFQRGSLSSLLQIIVLCMNLSSAGLLEYYPLVKFVKKFAHSVLHKNYVPEILEMHFGEKVALEYSSQGISQYLQSLDENSELKALDLLTDMANLVTCMSNHYEKSSEKENVKPDSDVFLWGNLKLLSSLKEEKLDIKIASVNCTEQLIVVLTLDGNLLSSEHGNEKMNLQPYKEFGGQLNVVQLACSYDGHFIILTKENKVLTWIDSNESLTSLTLIPLKLKGKVKRLCAGYNYYAVLTDENELCIWENILSGRTLSEFFTPQTFEEFEPSEVVDIAFSQFHIEVLIVTKGGKVWSWVNDKVKLVVNEDLDIVKVYIAKYFYVALSSNGQVWRWGRDRFSKVSSSDKIFLQSVEKLNKENVLHISVGAYHCIALTQSYNVFCWGGLGGKEEDESLIREPVLLKAVSEVGVNNIVAGPHQIFCWSVSFHKNLEKEIPFLISVKQKTFEEIHTLLKMVQEKDNEKLMLSLLKLLKLQFKAAIKFNVSPSDLGFDGEQDFSINLKDLVIELVSSPNYELRKVSEDILSDGWLYLLPNAEERAKTLSELLVKNAEKKSDMQSFMLNLLVTCLIDKNGLEELMEESLSKVKFKKRGSDEYLVPSNTLSILLKELFLVTTLAALDNQKKGEFLSQKQNRNILKVLLKYQRLLFARIFLVTEKDLCWPARCYVFEPTPTIKALTNMMNFYVSFILSSCKQILTCKFEGKLNSTLLMMSPVGVLFHEFMIYMIILQNYAPIIASNCDGIPQLAELLDLYDAFNKSFKYDDHIHEKYGHDEHPEKEMENENSNEKTEGDTREMEGKQTIEESEGEAVRDSENKGTTTDKASAPLPLTSTEVDILEQFAGREVSQAISNAFSCNRAKELVCQKKDEEMEKGQLYSINDLKRVCTESECNLAFFLGLHCCYLSHGMHPTQDEINHKRWLSSMLFRGRINKSSVLKDRSHAESKRPLIDDLLSESSTQSARILMDYIYRKGESHSFPLIPNIEKMDEHLERATKGIVAVLLWHSGLAGQMGKVSEKLLKADNLKKAYDSISLDEAMLEVVRVTLKLRTEILKKHQASGKSYESICKSVSTHCEFLCVHLLPSLTYKSAGNRWFEVVSKLNKAEKKNWRMNLWCKNRGKTNELYKMEQSVVLAEISKYIMDENMNDDVLRKCFLMQIKRAKQRLISGYLMQSLCLRQNLYIKVQYSLHLGWLGILVPGGCVSNSKPDALFNVELVAKDDAERLQEVFKSFENFAIKEFFEEFDFIKRQAADEKKDMQTTLQRSVKPLLLSITQLCTSLMSGEIAFLIQCGILDKIQFLLNLLLTTFPSSKEDESVPFIDERKQHEVQMEELNGPALVKLMKIGTRVKRGRDWKWDDQDGPSPSEGKVVSDIGEDGWVRVEWDTGSRNSYRMGKNGKYDLQIVHTQTNVLNVIQDKEKEDELNTSGDNRSDSSNKHDNPVALLKSALTTLVIHILSTAATSSVSEYTMNHITKFLIQTFRDLVQDNKQGWGEDLSIAGIFGLVRAICAAPEMYSKVTTEDWIDLSMKLFDLAVLKHNESAGANSLYIKLQLLQQIHFMIKDKDARNCTPHWKRSIVKGLFKPLRKVLTSEDVFTLYPTTNSPARSSMTSSMCTAVIEGIISLIRFLHTKEDWRDVINLEIWKNLKNENLKKIPSLDEKAQIALISSLCVIGSIDDRIRIGASVQHRLHNQGVVKQILPNGKILVQYEKYLKPKKSHLSKLKVFHKYQFDIKSLLEKPDGMLTMAALLDFVLNYYQTFVKIFERTTVSVTPPGMLLLPTVKLYVVALRTMHLIFQQKSMLFDVIDTYKKTYQKDFLHEILQASVHSCAVQHTYDQNELEIAVLALSQDLMYNRGPVTKKKRKVTVRAERQSKQEIKAKKELQTKKKSLDEDSKQLVQLLTAMGFPENYIEYALTELGGQTRPEQLVAWLLENPDVKVRDDPKKDKNKNDYNDSGGLSSPDMFMFDDGSDFVESSDSEYEEEHTNNSLKEIGNSVEENTTTNFSVEEKTTITTSLGCSVECIGGVDYIKEGDIGIVVKVMPKEQCCLVYWKRLDDSQKSKGGALWVTCEQLKVINTPWQSTSVVLEPGHSVHLKYDMCFDNLSTDDIGIVVELQDKECCKVYFQKNPTWSGKLKDLKYIELSKFCHICRKRQEPNNILECKTCTNFFICLNCSEQSNHCHSLVKLNFGAKPKRVSSSVLPHDTLNSERRKKRHAHDLIKEITASSNGHLTARMLNEEIDMAWESEASDSGQWILLKLRKNVLITELSLAFDPSDSEKTPKLVHVYGCKRKDYQLIRMMPISSNQGVVKILSHQDEIFSHIKIVMKNPDWTAKVTCKICHLKLSGVRRSPDYDEQILSLFCTKEGDSRPASIQIMSRYPNLMKSKATGKKVQVFCWGLNDKDQLGGLKGSKIKAAVISERFSSMQCKDFVCGSKSLFMLTHQGEVYTCGETTNGRLGLGDVDGNVAVPQIVKGLEGIPIKKLAVHSGGRHTLALSINGEVYSWGEGEDGKLGHGNMSNYLIPTRIQSLVGKVVTDIASGSAHSAAIVNQTELYTWGLGDYGRLGHGDEVTQLEPKKVVHLVDHKVVGVSCGSRDAQTVCLTDDGNVWSWGDGDFGKLGRGGSDGCLVPKNIEKLKDVGVMKILCGAQFTLALTTSGTVWTWGKGDFFRLGHGTDDHVREPKLVESLKDKNIVDVAVGNLHCLAVTEEGEIFAWGDNDHGQQGTGTITFNKTPMKVIGTEDCHIRHVACGSSHSVAWAEINSSLSILGEPIPFAVGRDPLGASYTVSNESENNTYLNLEKFMKEHRPTLACSVLELGSKCKKNLSLSKLLQTLDVRFARDFLFSLLGTNSVPSPFVIDDVTVKNVTNLLKIMLMRSADVKQTQALLNYLMSVVASKHEVVNILIDICIKELEEKIAENILLQERFKPSVHESLHPYASALGVKLAGSVKFPGAKMLTVTFDPQCQTEPGQDVLMFYDSSGRILARRTGCLNGDWSKSLVVSGDELTWLFTTNSGGGLWGFRFTVTPSPPNENGNLEVLSDESILQEPCLELVKRLLACDVTKSIRNEEDILKIVSLLSMCVRIKQLDAGVKKWMVDEMHALLISHNAPPIDVPAIMNCSRYRDPLVCKMRIEGNRYIKEAVLSSSLSDFIIGLPASLLKQYEFEEFSLRQGDQLLFSPFIRSLSLFACSLGLDTLPCCANKQQWAWFHRYCAAIRTAQSFIQRTDLPKTFVSTVRGKIQNNLQEDETVSTEHENHDLFSKVKDEQLLNWLNRRCQDWSIIWGGSGTIYGWGHNHRGQLGGIEGAKIKSPTICDALAALKPVQVIGGEQTLFCVTADGKIFATGYGNSSRLGLGIQESINSPRMIESLQHISIKKVAVHSGGRHCLALTTDGEVYSWGEGDDGKLGHGNRISCQHPKLIESFRGKVIVDIAAGGSHSAAIGENGELYTWGKGRYGRLGHGDGEDQLRPKQIENLQNFKVIDVACGSGDAQTLCITNNDAVWSWGDGDYGKLGRGGSDGCKIPIVIDYLTHKSVVKVECGSQFSMALTEYGVLYTWGKGDYYRLGHGSELHQRFPVCVHALESKIVTQISCGSLHCVVCTDDGEVYCWGDNDEGQLGDGTTNPGKLPKLCASLQNKKIDRITCGSAHTIAWSTYSQNKATAPSEIPLEYNQLKDIPIPILRNRAFLLHSFSKLFCSCIPMMDLVQDSQALNSIKMKGDLMVNALKGTLLSSFKENFFRKIVDVTMIRDRQHGPVLEINRVKKHRLEKDAAKLSDSKSVFGQLTAKMHEFSVECFFLPHRNWKVKFIGESVDDCGGGFSESIAEMCEELQNGTLPILIPSEPNRDDESSNSDYFVFNPDAIKENHKDMFKFLGVLLGIAIRSGNPLSLSLAEPIWKLLVGSKLQIDDLKDIDRVFVTKYSYLMTLGKGDQFEDRSNVKEATVEELELPFSVRTASGKDFMLSPKHAFVTTENKSEYLRSALQYKLQEFDRQICWVRSGLSQTIPVPILSLFTGAELENMVCGNPDIPVEAFKSITTYRGVEPLAPLVKWFWQALEEFTNHERSLFLRFVWGRTRLPRTAIDFKGKDFIFQVLDKYHPPDSYLPESYTCFFLLKMPRYSNYNILKEKLKYAIYFCKSIDSDDYARID